MIGCAAPYIQDYFKMTTPRFGEITVENENITQNVWGFIIDELKFDNNVWLIWNSNTIIRKWERACGMGSYMNEFCYYNIYLVDNYCNKYIIEIKWDMLQSLHGHSRPVKESIAPYWISEKFGNIKRGYKYDIPLSNEEISYVKKYCTMADADNIDVFRHKMSDYFSLQSRLTSLGNTADITVPLDDKIDKLLRHIEVIESTNMLQTKLIQDMEKKLDELQKANTDNSGFISYLKKLFAWN